MEHHSPAATERAMKIHEVILRAMSNEISWIEAADILGMSPRTMRRWKWRYDHQGVGALFDGRRRPSPRRTPRAELERILRLYRSSYFGFNVRHFHHFLRRHHGVTLSYSFVRYALQVAGLVKKRRSRGRHRRRREPRACLGEMLHLDGSRHVWLQLRPEQRQTLITVADDATKRVLYAQLWDGETTVAVMAALGQVLRRHGLPMALYTDRAGWAVHTRRAGQKPDPDQLTQVGRALQELGIEHILAYSPQARGRSERLNRTFQDRLVKELQRRHVQTLNTANRYLDQHFIPDYNQQFSHPPADPQSAFVPLGAVDLDPILCHQESRVVAPDNTVVLEGVRLQIDKQPGRKTCAGLPVTVRRHLDGHHTVAAGSRILGSYDGVGRPLPAPGPAAPGTRRSRRFAIDQPGASLKAVSHSPRSEDAAYEPHRPPVL